MSIHVQRVEFRSMLEVARIVLGMDADTFKAKCKGPYPIETPAQWMAAGYRTLAHEAMRIGKLEILAFPSRFRSVHQFEIRGYHLLIQAYYKDYCNQYPVMGYNTHISWDGNNRAYISRDASCD